MKRVPKTKRGNPRSPAPVDPVPAFPKRPIGPQRKAEKIFAAALDDCTNASRKPNLLEFARIADNSGIKLRLKASPVKVRCFKCKAFAICELAVTKGRLTIPGRFQCPLCSEWNYAYNCPKSGAIKTDTTLNMPDCHFQDCRNPKPVCSQKEMEKVTRERQKRLANEVNLSPDAAGLLDKFRADRRATVKLLFETAVEMRRALLHEDTEHLFGRGVDFLIACASEPTTALVHLANHLISPLSAGQLIDLTRILRDQGTPCEGILDAALSPRPLETILEEQLDHRFRFDATEHPWMRRKKAEREKEEMTGHHWCPARRYLKQAGMKAAFNPRNVMPYLDAVESQWRQQFAVPGLRGAFELPRWLLDEALQLWKRGQDKTRHSKSR